MSTKAIATAYFEAITNRDVDAMVALWKPGGREFIRGQVDTTAPDGVRAFFTELFGAVPDFDLQVQDMVVQKDRAAVRWRATSIRRSSAASGSCAARVMCSWLGCIHSSQPARSTMSAACP